MTGSQSQYYGTNYDPVWTAKRNAQAQLIPWSIPYHNIIWHYDYEDDGRHLGFWFWLEKLIFIYPSPSLSLSTYIVIISYIRTPNPEPNVIQIAAIRTYQFQYRLDTRYPIFAKNKTETDQGNMEYLKLFSWEININPLQLTSSSPSIDTKKNQNHDSWSHLSTVMHNLLE
jgi:hypothetical protein